jgi:N-acetylglucosamine kinase-like BadF-type ATPase
MGEGERLAIQLSALARQLLQRIKATRADTMVVGAAGAGRQLEQDELQTALAGQRLAWRTIVTTDADLACAAAFGGGPGILLIAGTGSIAIARNSDGSTRRYGGLGWRMGDLGSGYWIGRRALEAVGAMHDGLGPVTHLAEALCTAAHVPGIAGLVRWSVKATVAEVAALTPSVLGCADDGDPVAIGIRDAAAEHLAELAVVAGAHQAPVALSGGLLGHNRGLRERLIAVLEKGPGVSVVRRAIDPCRGAPVLAAEAGANS